jgi:hypothetical protein
MAYARSLPHVATVWDEGVNGIWAQLKPGWRTTEDGSCVHGCVDGLEAVHGVWHNPPKGYRPYPFEEFARQWVNDLDAVERGDPC